MSGRRRALRGYASREFGDFFVEHFARLTTSIVKAGASIEEAQDAAQQAMAFTLTAWPRIHNNPYAHLFAAARGILCHMRREREAASRGGSHSDTIVLEGEDPQQLLRLPEVPLQEQHTVLALTMDGLVVARPRQLCSPNRIGRLRKFVRCGAVLTST